MKPKFYIVGGYLRDRLLNIPSKDVDFAVECDSYQDMKNELIARGIEIFLENEKFLTIRGRHPIYGGVDYVCCRSELGYGDGRHPDEVKIGTIYDDLARRDATINALAEDEDGNILDPFGGREDLNNNLLRCVGDTYERFSEDSLRLLRIARFFVTKGFNLHEEIVDCFNNEDVVNLLDNISVERVREETFKMFTFNTIKSLIFFENFPLLRNKVFGSGLVLEPSMKKYKNI